MVIGSPLLPGSGAAAGKARATTPLRRATSEENSREKRSFLVVAGQEPDNNFRHDVPNEKALKK